MLVFWKNQIVWSKWSRKWVPAIVIDPDDDFEDLQASKPGYQHIWWLGDRRISLVNEDSIYDFCEYFNEFYPKMLNVEEPVRRATMIAVKLCAARAFNKRFTDEEDWESWAFEHIGEYRCLNVSDSFFKLFFPEQKDTTRERDETEVLGLNSSSKGKFTPALKRHIESLAGGFAKTSADNKIASDNSEANFQKGQLVWSKGVNHLSVYWPAVVLKQKFWYPRGVAVAIVTGSGPGMQDHIIQSLPSELHDFCYDFDFCFNSRKETDVRYMMAVRRAVQGFLFLLFQWVQKATGVALNDTEWKVWAKENISKSTGAVLNEDDLKKFMSIINGGSLVRVTKHQKQNKGKASPNIMCGRVAKKIRKLVFHDGNQTKKVNLFDGNRQFSEEAKKLLFIPLDQGWHRELCYRKTPSNKLGDIYYFAPPPPGSNKIRGKKLRSGVKVSEYCYKNNINLGDEHFCFTEALTGHPTNETARHALPGHWPVVREKGGKVKFIDYEYYQQ